MEANLKNSVFVTNGASNHSATIRQKEDFYATPPEATQKAINELKKYYDTSLWSVWEPCCGQGHISKVLSDNQINVVRNSDLVDRGFGEKDVDFLKQENLGNANVIFTNPPYKYFDKFLKHSLNIMSKGDLYICLGRIQILEGIERGKIYNENPPSYILVFRKRINCWKDGIETKESSAICYCWAVFEKGYKGDTIVRWI